MRRSTAGLGLIIWAWILYNECSIGRLGWTWSDKMTSLILKQTWLWYRYKAWWHSTRCHPSNQTPHHLRLLWWNHRQRGLSGSDSEGLCDKSTLMEMKDTRLLPSRALRSGNIYPITSHYSTNTQTYCIMRDYQRQIQVWLDIIHSNVSTYERWNEFHFNIIICILLLKNQWILSNKFYTIHH